MSFENIIAEDFDLSGPNSEFAETVTYKPRASESRLVTVAVLPMESTRKNEHHHHQNERMLQTFCSTDEEGIPSPAERDTMTRNDQVWNFHRIVEQTAAGVIVEWTSGQDRGFY